MQGDFSRLTFDPSRHFSRVLLQQGRVQLDSDWNEQSDIVLHHLRTLAADMIGPHGGPAGDGFRIVAGAGRSSVTITRGRYYVHGILCELEVDTPYGRQPDLPLPPQQQALATGRAHLVYLDVWERHLSAAEDPSIREVALGGPDTATRSKVVVQVKAATLDEGAGLPPPERAGVLLAQMPHARPLGGGRLRARARRSRHAEEAASALGFHGQENRLYRVEIHAGGPDGTATFKWSRENGSVAFPIRELRGPAVVVGHAGRDPRSALAAGDWVELVDEESALRGESGPLHQVGAVDRAGMVTLRGEPPPGFGGDASHHPLLRRWDQKAGGPAGLEQGAAPIAGDRWIDLEDGLQVWFSSREAATYRAGDYWLIPARAATGAVEWPGARDEPEERPPHGVVHHHAPLAGVTVAHDGTATVVEDYRRTFGATGWPVT